MIPIVAGLLMGAAMGGGIAALQGKDVLQGALMGGAGGALGGAFMPGIAGAVGGEAVGSGIAGAATSTPATAATAVNAFEAALPGAAESVVGAGGQAGVGAMAPMGTVQAGTSGIGSLTGMPAVTSAGGAVPGTNSLFGGGVGNFLSQNKYALAGGALGGMMAPGEKPPSPEQGNIREYDYTRGEMNPLFGNPGESYYTGGGYTAGAVTPVEDYDKANGGIIALAEGGQADRYKNPAQALNPAVAAYNAQIMERANQQYNINNRPGPNQVPGSAGYVAPVVKQQVAKQGEVGGLTFNRETGLYEGELNPLDGSKKKSINSLDDDMNVDQPYVPYDGGGEKNGGRITQRYSMGGISSLGNYSDGGQLLKGPGDGIEDKIPAQIGDHQPARLANNEFVLPARIVSEIGNGSTDAGAKRLYQMMDRVQKRRGKTVGKGKIAVDSKAHKELERL